MMQVGCVQWCNPIWHADRLLVHLKSEVELCHLVYAVQARVHSFHACQIERSGISRCVA